MECLSFHYTVFATKYLYAWTESRRGRDSSTSTLIQTLYLFFLLVQTVMYWAVLSRKFIPVIFLDCLAVLAITQLYQHILEAWRTCREAWGCLFGDRNIMTFWLETVRLSRSVNTADGLSYLMNLYYIWSEVWIEIWDKTEYVYSTCSPLLSPPRLACCQCWASASLMQDRHSDWVWGGGSGGGRGGVHKKNASPTQTSLSVLFVSL